MPTLETLFMIDIALFWFKEIDKDEGCVSKKSWWYLYDIYTLNIDDMHC